MARKKSKAEAADVVREEVVKALRSSSPSEREHRLVVLWSRWNEAKEYLKKVRAEAKDDVEMCRVAFDEAISEGVNVGDEDAALRKLHRAEIAYQNLEEARAKAKDGIGGAKDGVAGAFQQLSEFIAATNQLELELGTK